MGLFIIAVIVLLICVCLSRVGSKDLREVAVAVEIVFSIATVGGSDFITIRYYKEYSNYWQARSAKRNIGGY